MNVDNSSATAYRSPIQRWMWGVFAFLLVALSAASVLLMPLPAAAAGVGDWIKEMIALILSSFVFILGKLLLLAIYILTMVAQYNRFIEAAAVINGWVIVRDLANMFFIVILLIIAFATILNISSYQWKAMLPQLLIAAILINFSKLIAGILIDVSQVVTLTFVNGFAAAAGGNFGQMYQIQGLLTQQPPVPGAPPQPLDLLRILGGFFLAMILLIIAITITLIMAVIFAFRIVMLWALVVLSPLPWLLRVIPAGKKYADKWWTMFGEYLTIGPVLAFFLWLALVSVGTGTVGSDIRSGAVGGSQADADGLAGVAGPTQAATPDALMSFVIAICMLIAGMKIAGEMGVMGAGAMKGAADKMGSIAKGAAKKFTGYRYVSERVSGAMAMHEAARKEKVQAGAAKLYGAYGATIAAPGKGIDALKNKLGVTGKFSPLQARAKKAREEAAGLRQKGDLDGARKAEARARRWERGSAAAGYAWKAGMVAAAPVTGGASLLGLAPAAIRQMQKGGAAAQAAGKDYKYKEVSKALDAMKDQEKDEVLATMQGKKPGATSHERAAAFLRATKEGWVESNEVAGGEDFLQSLGADQKTVSTFKSYAEQKYPGTMVSGDERRKRIEAGTMPTKDLHPEELSKDGGSLAADFVHFGTAAQRKDLGQSKALKAAYQAGLQAAAAKEADPEKKQKLQAELMRLGKGPKDAAGNEPSALAYSGLGADLAALGKALQGPLSSEILANIDEKDLADPAMLDAIAQNVNAARLNAAVGQAKKPDADPQAQVNLAALQAALRKTPRAQAQEKSHAKVRGAESNLSTLRRAFDNVSAAAARGDAAAQARLGQAEAAWRQAQKDIEAAVTSYEQEMDAAGIGQRERDLYEAMKKPKAKK